MKSFRSKLILCVIMVSLIVIAVPVIARGPSKPAGRSNVGLLYLVEKDHTDPNWPVIEGGAWGKMKYTLSGPEFMYLFNGHGLEPGMMYVLIYYPDPWPGDGLIILSEPTAANADGNIHLRGAVDTCDLPAEDDENYPDGAKIWLVLADDVAITNKMVRWNPSEYLFEYDLMTFDDTNCN